MKTFNSFKLIATAAALLLTSIACSGQNLSALPNAPVKPLGVTLIGGTVSVSSEPYGGFSKENLTDNNANTPWSSQLYSSATHTEWVSYRFAAATQANFVKLETRYFTPQSRALGFPVNFRILALDTNAVLATYTNYTTPNTNAAVILSFPTANITGVKIEATQLGTEDNNSYVFQLTELSVGNDTGTSSEISVSSEPYGGFSKANLTDNNTSTAWSSQLYSSANNTEWVSYRFAAAAPVNFVKLETRFFTPQSRALGFPVNFRILALDTNTVLATYTNYAIPNTSAAVTLSFPVVTAAGVKIEATQLGTEDNNSYVFQLSEVSVGNDTGISGGVNVSSEPYGGFPKLNLIDGSASTAWSSQLYSTANHTESVEYRLSAATRVNFVKLETRFAASQNRALGFPVDFRILALDTGVVLRTFTNFPTPNSSQPIILSFAGTNIAGVRIEATKLGTEDNNSYVFQLSELSVGNNPTYDKFAYVGNSASANVFEVRGIGAGAFNPTRMSNWVFDERRPLITANNIYAPSIVKNNGTWNIYFGGWNDSNQNDKVYLLNSQDDFLTFQNPDGSTNSIGKTVIQQGVFIHTNNESVIKVGSNDWRMLLTTYPVAGQNKPMYATSNDGINFTPSAGTLNNNITMTGYPNWVGADVNGGNVLYFENGVYHMYFVDFNNFAVHHATSTDFVNYTYQGVALNEGRVINDFKRFDFGGAAYYVAVTHVNRGSIRASVSTNLNTLPPSEVLFSSKDAQDAFITSVGLVTDGNRLLGAIYGAANQAGLDNNRLFGVWLQKKVLFTNSTITWGEGGSSFGPNRFKVSMTQPVQTGQLKIFDTDGTTLLTQSPELTVLQGDIWEYRP